MVVCGGTGCGKTTQVPQYLIEDYTQQMQGSACNIIVTQPRRISAISIAKRIAYEMGMNLGESVGYQVLNVFINKALYPECEHFSIKIKLLLIFFRYV